MLTKNILDYVGVWTDIDIKEWNNIKKSIKGVRKGMDKSFNKRIGDFL